MARLVSISFLFFLIACATPKKAAFELPLELKNKLFASQEKFELYKSFNDPLFLPLTKNKCIGDWENYVHGLNLKLRGTKKNEERVMIWYDLANCYNYIAEYKKAVYYYDLLLSVEKENRQILSIASSNIGIIYELKGLDILSKSYYETSLGHNPNNHIAKYMLALQNLRQGEFQVAEQYLEELAKNLPKSKVIHSTLGVSFSLSDNNSALKSKVFKFFNEKDEERVLFNIALKMYEGTYTKDDYEDLKDLELKFPILHDYRNYLLNKFGSKNG